MIQDCDATREEWNLEKNEEEISAEVWNRKKWEAVKEEKVNVVEIEKN